MECYVGSTVRSDARFVQQATGQPADPTTVKFYLGDPGGPQKTYVYGVDVELVRDGVGLYHIELLCDHEGEWIYRWEGTGALNASTEGFWPVKLSEFL